MCFKNICNIKTFFLVFFNIFIFFFAFLYFCNVFFLFFSIFAEFAGDLQFLLDSCLTTAQPLPRQQSCKEGRLMLTQWQNLVVCTSLQG